MDKGLRGEPITCDDLYAIQGDIRNNLQGIYANLIATLSAHIWGFYLGSGSYQIAGQKESAGLRWRISQHQSEEHRKRYPSPHYQFMDQPDHTSTFVVLAVFAEPVSTFTAQLVEEALMLIFGAFFSPGNVSPIRYSMFLVTLNRRLPLIFQAFNSDDMSNEAVERRKAKGFAVGKTRANKNNRLQLERLDAGQFKIWSNNTKTRVVVQIGGYDLRINSLIMDLLGLEVDGTVNVTLDLVVSGHPHWHAIKATPEDPSYMLGI